MSRFCVAVLSSYEFSFRINILLSRAILIDEPTFQHLKHQEKRMGVKTGSLPCSWRRFD